MKKWLYIVLYFDHHQNISLQVLPWLSDLSNINNVLPLRKPQPQIFLSHLPPGITNYLTLSRKLLQVKFGWDISKATWDRKLDAWCVIQWVLLLFCFRIGILFHLYLIDLTCLGKRHWWSQRPRCLLSRKSWAFLAASHLSLLPWSHHLIMQAKVIKNAKNEQDDLQKVL